MKLTDSAVIPPDVLADVQAVIDHLVSGKPLDPDTGRRVAERAERITEELTKEYGVLDIGVPAIRELRGELPE